LNVTIRFKPVIWLAALTTLLAIYFGFFGLTKQVMETCYRQATFYFLLVASMLFLQQFTRVCSIQNSISVRRHILPVCLSAIVVGAIFMAVQPDFRILADETNLLGISQTMYDRHECSNPTQAWRYYHDFRYVLTDVVDMRPAFFPFMVYVAHALTGYRPENAFVVNALAAFAILALFYLLLQNFFGRFYATVGMGLVASFPLFALYVTSAGFETVNLLCLILLTVLMFNFIKNRSAENAELAFLLLPLLAQTRYESALTVVVAIPMVLYLLPKEQYEKLTFRSVFVPLLFLPVAWLRIVTYSEKAFQVSSVDQAFGLDLFYRNLQKAVTFFAGFNRDYGMVPVLGFFAVAGFVSILVDSFEKRDNLKSDSCWLSAFIAGAVIVHAAARFFYFWGDLTLQFTSRLGLVFLPVMAFLSLCFIMRLQRQTGFARSWAAIFVLVLIIHGWPVAGQNAAVRDIYYYREFRSARDWLEREHPEKKHYIIVSDLANLYIPLNYSAVNHSGLEKNSEKILKALQKGTWQYLIIIQKIDIKTGLPLDGSDLKIAVDAKVVFQTQLNIDQMLRFSIYKPAI